MKNRSFFASPAGLLSAVLIAALLLSGCAKPGGTENENGPSSALADSSAEEQLHVVPAQTAERDPEARIEYTYTLNEKREAVITGCETEEKEIVLPGIIDGYPVREIGDRAFSGCGSIEKLTVPEGIRKIGLCAFERCAGLVSVTLPESLEQMADAVFYYCTSLKEITLPASITDVPDYLCYHCEALEKVSFAEDTEKIGHYAFGHCAIAEIDFGEKTAEIGDYCFEGCPVKKAVFPQTLKKLGKWAFFDCGSLEEVLFPDGVEKIGDGAFYNCASLRSLVVPENAESPISYLCNGCIALEEISFPYVGPKENSPVIEVFSEWFGENITDKLMPVSVRKIELTGEAGKLPEHYFYECDNITDIVIKAPVREIGRECFIGCASMETVTLPEVLEKIGDDVFAECPSLKKIVFGGSAEGWESFLNANAEALESPGNSAFLSAEIVFEK